LQETGGKQWLTSAIGKDVMENTSEIKEKIEKEGFAIIDSVYSEREVEDLLSVIAGADTSKETFRKTNDLFAIRQFFKEIPASVDKIFTPHFIHLLSNLFGREYFVIKSIYFDKPEESNWFVSYHQDLTISVDKKLDLEGFGPWTTKQNQFAVQPPFTTLADNFTVRIHLDTTNAENGALKVIPTSHLKGIIRPETIDWTIEKEVICHVQKGGIMIMKPLLLHSSGRTTNNRKRRVVHVEFSRGLLPYKLHWAEHLSYFPPSA
jgi:hypothetical protein